MKVHAIATRRTAILVIIAMWSVFSATHAHAGFISNGSFELGSFVEDTPGSDGMTLAPAAANIDDWTTFDADLIWVGPSSNHGYTLSAQNGDHFLNLATPADDVGVYQYGGVSRTIDTIVGQRYELSFYLGAVGSAGFVGMKAMAGSTFDEYGEFADDEDKWIRETLVFKATATSTDISIVGLYGIEFVGLDNVSVRQLAVPEPASLALWSLGAVGLTFARRRRNRRNSTIA